jgi:hypothetical protein
MHYNKFSLTEWNTFLMNTQYTTAQTPNIWRTVATKSKRRCSKSIRDKTSQQTENGQSLIILSKYTAQSRSATIRLVVTKEITLRYSWLWHRVHGKRIQNLWGNTVSIFRAEVKQVMKMACYRGHVTKRSWRGGVTNKSVGWERKIRPWTGLRKPRLWKVRQVSARQEKAGRRKEIEEHEVLKSIEKGYCYEPLEANWRND